MKWTRGHAYLHERLFVEPGGHVGMGRYEERYLGRVETRDAKRWEARGDRKTPPPLKGLKLPPAPEPSPDRSNKRTQLDEKRPLAAGEDRLAMALWWGDVMMATETERFKRRLREVERYNAKWWKDLQAKVEEDKARAGAKRAVDEKRRPPKRAPTLALSRSRPARPRCARRLRRP